MMPLPMSPGVARFWAPIAARTPGSSIRTTMEVDRTRRERKAGRFMGGFLLRRVARTHGQTPVLKQNGESLSHLRTLCHSGTMRPGGLDPHASLWYGKSG